MFHHNSPEHLDAVLRAAIAEGQPRTGRPWKKVLVVVEGIYSMEGEMARLQEIVEVKKKYKVRAGGSTAGGQYRGGSSAGMATPAELGSPCAPARQPSPNTPATLTTHTPAPPVLCTAVPQAYLYLDEAHSVGALGPHGRGVTEQLGVDPADVDIMMGTFTKSFGSCGGYIAGDAGLIAYLRAQSPAHLYATAMSPPAVEMVTSALHVIMGRDGTGRGAAKIARLRDNSNYVRRRLLELGFNVLGDWDSPVMVSERVVKRRGVHGGAPGRQERRGSGAAEGAAGSTSPRPAL